MTWATLLQTQPPCTISVNAHASWSGRGLDFKIKKIHLDNKSEAHPKTSYGNSKFYLNDIFVEIILGVNYVG